jgi:hypothetical protein
MERTVPIINNYLKEYGLGDQYYELDKECKKYFETI